MIKRKKGYSLLELLLGLSIILLMTLLDLQKQKQEADKLLAKTVGGIVKLKIGAMMEYANSNSVLLQKGLDPNCGGAIPPKDASYNPGVGIGAGPTFNICEIPEEVLYRKGVLPLGSAGNTSAYKTNFKYYFRVNRAATGLCTQTTTEGCNIEALVMPETPWLEEDGTPMFKALGLAAREGGNRVGVIGLDRVARGVFDSWRLDQATDPNGVAFVAGKLIGYDVLQANTFSSFLNRRGGTISGDLNMGNYRINNLNDAGIIGPEDLQKNQFLSTMIPKMVFKGVYNVVDYEKALSLGTPAFGRVQKPICADSDQSAQGIPKIILKSSALYNEFQAGDAGGTPSDTPAGAAGQTSAPQAGWAIYAKEEDASNWLVFIRRYYDAGYLFGEGFAEVYCYYP